MVSHFLREEEYNGFCRNHKKLIDFYNTHPFIYLYGNGRYADVMHDYMEHAGLKIKGNCISGVPGKDEHAESILKLPAEEKERAGFIFAVKQEYQQKIIQSLDSKGIEIDLLCLEDDFYKTCRDYMAFARKMNRLPEIAEKETIVPLTVYDSIEKKVEMAGSGKNIILQRQYGMGDAFYLEPIARKLNHMGYSVFISTDYGFVFDNCDYLIEVFPYNSIPQWILKRSFLIDFFNAYERRPYMHILDAYIEQTREIIPDFDLASAERIPIYDESKIHTRDKSVIKKICINFEVSEWKSRMYSRSRTERIIRTLGERGYEIYEIGSNEDYYLGIGKNCYGISFKETMALMSQMDLYIGLDNGLMHFAQSLHVPIFVLFGCTCPLYRVIDWDNARVMWRSAKELVCAGCHHRIKTPNNYTHCGRDRHYCMDWTPEAVLEAFDRYNYSDPPVLSTEDRIPICWIKQDWSDKE